MNDQSHSAFGEQVFPGKIAVICSEDEMHTVVRDELDITLPQEPNTTTANGDIAALWLSPHEWMLVTPQGREQDLATTLNRALAGFHALIVDVSDRWAVISVTGTEVLPVLKKGTSVQLQSPAFGVGRCCQTKMFSVPVIIRQTDESPSFDVFVDSTFYEHLWHWFEFSADGLDFHMQAATK